MNPFHPFDFDRIGGRRALFAAFATVTVIAAAFAGISMIGEDSDAADPVYLATGSIGSSSAPITDFTKFNNGSSLVQLTAGHIHNAADGAYVAVGSDVNIIASGAEGSIIFGITSVSDGFGVTKTTDAEITDIEGVGHQTYRLAGSFTKTGICTIGTIMGGQTTGGQFTSKTVTINVVEGSSSSSSEPAIDFTSPSAVDTISGSSISYQATTNITGTAFTATGTGNASWLTLTSAGLLSGTAPSVSSKTTAAFSILATSPGGQTVIQKVQFDVYPVAQLTVSSTSVSGKVGTAVPAVSITSNIACSYSIQAVSGSLSDLGLTWNASAGTISGTPTATGSATVRIIGTTTVGPSQSPSVEIAVTIGESDLAITSEPPTGIFAVGKNWSYSAVANQTVTWSLVNAPSWLSVDSTGRIAGQVSGYASATIVTFQLKAVTAGGQTAMQNISISVEPTLAYTSIPTAACTVTPIYDYKADGTYQVMNSRFDDLDLPILSSRMVLGEPMILRDAVVGEAEIDYTAPDAIDAITGSRFTYNASTNITGTVFSKVSGAEWLAITSAGVVSGSAPSVTEKTDYQIVIKATSPKGQTIEQTVTITVYPVAKLTASALSTSVHQNSAMNSITITSNVDVAWSKSGDLPAGVTFSNGVLSGAPSVQGSFEITVFGTTIEGPAQTASVKVRIVVGEPVVEITSTGPAMLFIVGNQYSYAPTTNVPGTTFTISDAPAWLGVTGGVVKGQVTGYTDGTTVTYTLTATTPEAQIATQSVTIVIEPVLAWTSIPTASCIVQATYTYSDDGSYTQNVLNSRAMVMDDAYPVTDAVSTYAPNPINALCFAPPKFIVLMDDSGSVPDVGGTNVDVTETETRTFRFLWTGEDAETVTWDFGDGTTGEGFQVVHTYEANGTYTYTCTGTNSVGSSSVQGRIIVDVEEDDGISIYLVAGLALLIVILCGACIHHRKGSVSRNTGSRRSR